MITRHIFIVLLVTASVLGGRAAAAAMIYDIRENESVIGEIRSADAGFNDTLLDIGRTNGFGYYDLKLLNPDIDTWIPGEGKTITLPSQFILPDAPREGVVLNIPEMRLYYFPAKKPNEQAKVITYPLGVGREGWSTPYVQTTIIAKTVNPAWYPPESIRQEHDENGESLPEVVEAGPDNPLGDYALRLGIPSYLIHGTNKPYGVGMRVSHGCIRLYPEDIEDLFNRVEVGTPVNIINQPYKVGMMDGVIYLEVHPYLDEDQDYFSQNSLTEVVKYIISVTPEEQYKVDWALVRKVVSESKGVPVPIGMYIPGMQKELLLTQEDKVAKEAESTSTALLPIRPERDEDAIWLRLETRIDPKKLKQK